MKILFVENVGGANILSGDGWIGPIILVMIMLTVVMETILIGGRGDDILSGGGGIDVFRFYLSEGVSDDLIRGFSDGEIIELVDDTGEATSSADHGWRKIIRQ